MPLSHYHIPPRKHTTTVASPAVTAFLSQAETLISFLLLPRPDDERIRSHTADVSTVSDSTHTSASQTPGAFVLQRPYLRTARSVTVKHVIDLLSRKFSLHSELGFVPSSLDFLVPASPSSNPQGGEEAKQQQTSFTISVVPSRNQVSPQIDGDPTAQRKENETEDKAAGKMEAEAYVELDESLSIGAIASKFWDGSGDLTLYYHLAQVSS